MEIKVMESRICHIIERISKTIIPNIQAVPSKNDLVLVFDDKQPQQKWLFGKITKLIPSNDGKI